MYYYELLEGDKIGKYTNNAKVAEQNGLTFQTDEEIKHIEGCYYLESKYNEIINSDEYKEKQKQKERERISKLSLTKREVFLALFKAKGLTPEMIRSQITDTEALIEFDYAIEYFRFNPLIDKIGAMLGYSSDDIDYLFEHKALPVEEVENDNSNE